MIAHQAANLRPAPWPLSQREREAACYNHWWMKKSIRIVDGVAEFFGTHDGNIKYLESLLKVQVHIDGENNLTIDGEDENVELVERLVSDYTQLRAEGVKLAASDLKSI